MPRLLEAIRANADPMTLMTRVVDQALLLVPAAEGAAVQIAGPADHVTCVCAAGSLEGAVGIQVLTARSLSGLAMRDRATLTSPDVRADARVDHSVSDRFPIGSLACIPLWRGAQPVGVLTLSAPTTDAFDDEAVRDLGRLAEFISTVVAAASDLARITNALLDGELRNPTSPATSTFMANVLQPEILTNAQAHERIERLLADRAIKIAYQPVVDLRTGQLTGVEALARFTDHDSRPPDQWFIEAHGLGLGVELESAAVEIILSEAGSLPAGVSLGINTSPSAAVDPDVQAMILQAGVQVVLEVTEHDQVGDYRALREGLAPLRRAGVSLAVDDTGAGFASLHHILQLEPDVLKLDRGLTIGIDADPVRRALGTALVQFAQDIGADTVAEGIETRADLATVRELGMRYGQGFALGRPGPLAQMRHEFDLGPMAGPSVTA